jgi:MFS family permease
MASIFALSGRGRKAAWQAAGMADGRGGLLRHADFRRLWIGDTISQVGSAVTEVALPFLAIAVVHASTVEVGVLRSLEALPFLLIGLPAGAWVDRMRRRRVLLATDALRAVALGSLPVAYALGVLGIGQVFAAAAVAGVGTVFFGVAYQSYLPELVGPDDLVEGNTKLQASQSVAMVAGPTLGGVLIAVIGAPYALAVDAASFVWSGAWVARIRVRPPRPARAADRSLRREVAEGVRFVLGHRQLRAITMTTTWSNLATSANLVMMALLLLRTLHLGAGRYGLTYSAGAVGGLLGAFAARRLGDRFGAGRTLVIAIVVAQTVLLVQPFVQRGWLFALLLVALFVEGLAVVVFNVIQLSFRQGLCPPNLLGRMNATVRFLVTGTNVFGGLLGGVLGTALGLRTGLLVVTLAGLLAIVPVASLATEPQALQ